MFIAKNWHYSIFYKNKELPQVLWPSWFWVVHENLRIELWGRTKKIIVANFKPYNVINKTYFAFQIWYDSSISVLVQELKVEFIKITLNLKLLKI